MYIYPLEPTQFKMAAAANWSFKTQKMAAIKSIYCTYTELNFGVVAEKCSQQNQLGWHLTALHDFVHNFI